MAGKHHRTEEHAGKRVLLTGLATVSAGGAMLGVAGTAQADPLSDLGIRPVPVGLSSVFTGSAGPQKAAAAISTGSAQVGTGSSMTPLP
ncbi:hypothetical protein [Skermania piniformis]|uniref:Uncharacterized protein n=1 Tax=Skermania pinensis TaxID=39122 RepID=A0ABX8SCG7_9ACTN|nr:hypothetical protein [Skermania piniformis]QXQ14674.1 hypothetical protein KV203_04530 [Skermania piniformis]